MTDPMLHNSICPKVSLSQGKQVWPKEYTIKEYVWAMLFRRSCVNSGLYDLKDVFFFHLTMVPNSSEHS